MAEVTAISLSILWPGLGHIYLGRFLGVLYFFIWLFIVSKSVQLLGRDIFSDPDTGVLIFIGVGMVFWIVILVDIYRNLREPRFARRQYGYERGLGGSFLWVIPFFIFIFAFIFFSLPYRWRSKSGSVGNLHTYTTCSDGEDNYEVIINEALRLGFDFIVLTDYNFWDQKGCLNSSDCDLEVCKKTYEKCISEDRILCIPGQEIKGVGVLAIGTYSNISSLQSIIDLVDEIHVNWIWF